MTKNVAERLEARAEAVPAWGGYEAANLRGAWGGAAQIVRDAVPPEDWARVREIRDGAVMTDRREAALTRVLEAYGEES